MGQPRGLRLAIEGQDYRCLRGTGFPVVKAQPTTAAGTRTPVPPQPGPRVACCGCSFTYGVGVEDAESYPARLETLLPQTAVLNFGRRNYGLRLVMEWYRTFAAPLRPTVAVVQLPYVMRQPFPGVQPRQRVHYTANFGATWSVLDCRWRDSWRVMAAMDTLMGRDLRRLEVFVGWLKAQGTVPVVLLNHGAYGILETVQGRYLARAEELSYTLGVKTVEVPWLGKALLLDGSHPTALGNRAVAEAVAPMVRRALCDGCG